MEEYARVILALLEASLGVADLYEYRWTSDETRTLERSRT